MGDDAPRLPLTDVEPSNPASAILTRIASRADAPVHVYRTLSHAPAMMSAWADFGWTLRDNAASPRSVREAVILRIAAHRRSRYVWAHHVPMAAEAGLTTAQVTAVGQGSIPDRTQPLTAAVRLADDLCATGELSDEAYVELSRWFSPAEIVELVMTGGFYLMAVAVVESLKITLEEQHATMTYPWD